MLSDTNLILATTVSPMVVSQTISGNATAASVVSGSSIDRLSNQDFGSGASMSLVFNTEATVVPGKNDAPIITTVVSGSAFGLGTHGLTAGSPVVLRTAGVSPVLGNFTGGTTYYVIRGDSGNIALATSFATSLITATPIVTADVPSSLTLTTLPTLEFQIITAENPELTKSVRVAGSSGAIPVNVPRQVSITETANVETANVVLAAADQYETGTAIVFTFTGGTVSPLISGAVYYVTLPTTAGFKVATSYVNALAGISLDLVTPSSDTPITVKVADNMLVLAGPQIFVDFNPRAMGPNVGQQYIGARIVPSAPLSAGSFSAKFSIDGDTAVGGRGVRAYTSGYTI